jgi:tripartite-type tricarboxylate transporter receptor subunit TctC
MPPKEQKTPNRSQAMYSSNTRIFFTLVWLWCICSVAISQTTAKPIHLIVPYAAGGPIDVTARVLAERVKDSLGTVVVENRPGAGGNIGADFIAKAAPDGLTIGIAATATHAVNPWLYSRMPYNAATDFAPITQILRVPNVLVMNTETAKRLGIQNFNDFMRYTKAHPGKHHSKA